MYSCGTNLFLVIKHWLGSEQFIAAYFPFLTQSVCRDSKSEHSFYLFNPVCAIVSGDRV
jgi:hypothetical protein